MVNINVNATPLEPSPTYSEWSALMASAMTVKIQDGKGDYIVINAVDFDPDTMKKLSTLSGDKAVG